MHSRLVLGFLMVIVLSANFLAVDADVRGKVSNTAGKPIAKAVVALARLGVKDTTGADGLYLLATAVDVTKIPLLQPRSAGVTIYRQFLDFSLPEPSAITVELFNVKGRLLKRVAMGNAARGFYRFNIEENAGAEKLLIVKASIGRHNTTFRYLPLNNGRYAVDYSVASSASAADMLAKITAVDDTIKVTAANYKAKSIPINSYDQELNITLDTASQGGVRPSPGCGKQAPFTGEKRFTINVQAAGTGNRDYILRLPDDYDPNHPYALWFAIHCLNGTADQVAKGGAGNNYEYYGIWKLANPKGQKGTTIFCSPQGISNAWGQGQKDLEFFRAMIAKFENELCIDMSRIFASGFSMGGSQSYALACAMPDTFRAVCMHSGGSMSGCDQKKRGPVPMFITHGTTDNVCTYPSYGIPQLKDLAQRDGCTAMDIPSMVNPTSETQPQCVDYKNCNPGYPCRACIFKGSHTPSPGGEKNTWVDDSTWSWFKQFY